MPAEKVLTAAELGEILGFHENVIRRWAQAGKLPCERYGPNKRSYRFDLAKVRAAATVIDAKDTADGE